MASFAAILCRQNRALAPVLSRYFTSTATRSYGKGQRLNDVVIASAVRTPIGSFRGSLSSLPATKLGSIAIRAAVERAEIQPEQVRARILINDGRSTNYIKLYM